MVVVDSHIGDIRQSPRQHHPLPHVLLVKKPLVLAAYLPDLSNRFDLIKAYESHLPIVDFLAAYGKTVKAMICSGATMVNGELIDLLPSLELIVTTSTGLNQIDVKECWKRGIRVANAGDVFSEDCADLAVGLLIDVLRKVTFGDKFVRSGGWGFGGVFPLGFRLRDKRVGIIGLGSIGIRVAKRIEAFGCSISYNSRKPKSSFPYPFYSNVCELAANSDVLIICCTLTPQTHHMVNNEVLKALGRDGVVVNIARGAIIDEKELVRCLVEGEIRGAGLDVFENEPNVPVELFSLDNVVLSPHNAVLTPESIADLYKLIVRNLDAFFSKKPLVNLVEDV